MSFSTFSQYNYLLDEEDEKKKKPSQVAAQEQKFKTFTRLGEEALQFKEPTKQAPVETTPARTPSIWETVKKKAGEVVSKVGQAISKAIPGGTQVGIERIKQAPLSSYIIGAGQTLAEQAGRQYITDTLSMAVNAVQGVGKLTPAYQTYRAVLGNPVTPKEYAIDLLATGLDTLGLTWRMNPIAPAVGATLNTWVDVRKYFQGKIDAGELIYSPARGIAKQPGVGEVITDNVNWASAIDVAFMATMFAKPFLGKKLNQLNLKATEINNLKATLGVEPSSTMKQVSDAFKAKMKELPDTFTANPSPENMALRKQLTNAFNALKKTNAIEQKYAQAYDFIQSKLGKMEKAIQPQPVTPKPKQLPSGEKPPIKDINKPLNIKNAEIIKSDVLSGKKEVTRLSNPDQLKIAISYPANNLSETATPDTLVKVYRAGTDIETKMGDFVTLDKANAEKYIGQREGSKVMTAQVPLKDLVFSGGLKSEFIYAPKGEIKPPAVTTEVQKTEGLEPAEYSETNLIVKEGDYIVDRNGVLKIVTAGNDKDVGNATNEGFIRSAEIGGKPNIYQGKEIGYIDYANQIRKATPEEIAQATKGVGGEIKTGQDIKDLDAQIRTIKEPTKENPDWVVEIGLQESLGEKGGDIVTWDYDSKPTLEEVRKDILDEYKRTKKEINKEVAMGVVAKSGREEMIEGAIDKVLSTEKPITETIGKVEKPIKPTSTETAKKIEKEPTIQSKAFPKTDVQKAFKALKTSKASLPILGGFKVKDGRLTATSLDVSFSIPTDKEDGLYTFIGSDIVKSQFTDMADYPELPEPPKETAFEILPDYLADLIKKASLSVEKSDQRPILQGIHIDIKDGKLSVASTDGYRLFYKTLPAKTLKDMTFNISNPNDLQRILGLLPDEKIAIKVNDKIVSFHGGDSVVMVKNIQGAYPAYDKIMGNYQERIIIDKKALSDAIKAVKPYTKDVAYNTKFDVQEKELIVYGGRSADKGGVGIKEVKIPIKKKAIDIPQGTLIEGTVIMPVITESGDEGFGLNNNYVSDMLSSLDGDTVYMDTASKDGVIEPRTPKFFSDKEQIVKKSETPIVPPTPQTTPKKETPETYKGDASVGWFADVENVTRNIGKLNVMEFPEMLRLAKELLGGVPMVKMTRMMKNAYEASGHTQIMGGAFIPAGNGKIIMNPDIFKDPSQTAKTLSHEMGHLTDFIPEGTMARGNLLGRLASLKKYMSNFLPDKPGGKGELTEKDRARLRRQAVKEAQMPVTVEEEVVVGEAKATPKEIIAIWNDMSSGITTPDLLKYIQTLDSRQKVEIVKEAMKGTIPAWVTFVNKIKKMITHEVIKNAPEDIRRIYKKLLEQEVEKRRLFHNETIKKELKGITEMWRPYDPQRVSVEYEKYRNSSKELYADAISVLLNDPARLERDAPTFFKAFFNYIDRKQEFRDNFFAIQEILNKGDEAVFAERDKVMEEAYKTAEDKFFVKEVENRKRKSNLLYIIQSLFDNKNQIIWNKVREAQKKGVKIEDAVNPAFEAQGLNYLDAFTKNFIADTFQPVFEESQQVSNGWTQLGKVLQLERAIYERGDMANPQGYDPKTAQDQLNYLKTTMSEQDWNKIMSAKAQFRTSVKKFISYAEKNKFYTPELLKTMKANPAYSAFQVIDYLDTYLSSRVYKSVGTLKDVANTATSTVMKMVSVIRAVERNKVKVDMTDFLTEAFPKEIEPAETRYAGKNRAKEILEPKDKDKALVVTIEDGKPIGFYVDKEIGKSLNNATNETINMIAKLSRLISGSPFYRPLFTTVNLGFQSFNFFRDFSRYWKNVPDYTFGKALTSFPRAIYRYAQAVPHAISRATNKPTDIVKAMENSKILGLSFNDIFREPVDADDVQIERVLQKVGVLEKTKHKKLLTPFYWVLDKIDSLGNFIESLPKIAGYIELKGQGRMSEQEMAQFIRTKLGSPDFRTTGYATSISNNIFLFSNAIKEGIKSDFQIATGRAETGKYSQSSFWWKTVLTNFLPTFITVAAGMGLLGKWYQDRFNDVSEYDKTNYTILPLGVDENGKTVYLRIPRDETGRFYGGIFYKLLKMVTKKELPGIEDALQVFSFGAGQFPTLSPNFTGIGAMVQYMSGQNPYDTFRGRTVIPDREFQAGFKYSFPVFMKWLLQNQGMGIIIPNYVNDNPSKLEKMVGMPVVSNVLGRWIKTSDYGKTEQLKEIGGEVKKGKAQQALEEDKMIADAVKAYKKSGDTSIFGKTKVQRETVKAIMNSLPKEKRTKQKQTLLTKEIQIAFIKGEADANLKSLIYATSNDEKVDVLKNLKASLSSDKYNELKKTVLKYKIVSTDVFKKVK